MDNEKTRLLNRFNELVRNQRAKRVGENERNFEKLEMDHVQALVLRLFKRFAVVEVSREDPGELYIALYIDGKPAPHPKDMRGILTRRDSKVTVACGRSYDEINEQLEFLKKHDLLPSVVPII